ncbi:MAG: hypothetical protein MRZ59_05455 [Clostridiales bacterium]|nr:hypothetical protein [Clostridiales bacterium]
MLIRMCPLCDHEMKKRHYCETCGSFIWKPELLDVHLNEESRGYGEENCAYPVSSDHIHQGDHKKRSGQQKQKNQNTHGYQQTGYDSSGKSYSTVHKGKAAGGTGAKKKNHFIAVVVIVVILVSVIKNIAENFDLSDISEMIENITEDGDFNVFGNNSSEEEVSDIIELSHDEVIKNGKPCTGYIHLQADGKVIHNKLIQFTETAGFTVSELDEFIDERNTVHTWGDEDTSYYETNLSYADTTYTVHVTTSMDSFDHQLHNIFMTFNDLDTAKAHLNDAMKVLEEAEIDIGNWQESMADDVLDFGSEDYQFNDIGVVEIYTSVSDYDDGDHYIIEISAQ